MTDITRSRGDTYPIEILVTANGAPLDVTSATFKLTVDPSKAPVDDSANLFSLTGVVTDGPAGAVAFTPTAMQADRVGKFYYDVQMVDGSGAIRTVLSGKFTLTQDITKA
jgi:hypothetical protein